MSVWQFGCKKGLRQQGCAEYSVDTESRGYALYGGCPSCKNRVPANTATASAEAELMKGV